MQVVRENMKDFIIFLDFIKILNLDINKLLYLDITSISRYIEKKISTYISLYTYIMYINIYIYYVHYAVDPYHNSKRKWLIIE